MEDSSDWNDRVQWTVCELNFSSKSWAVKNEFENFFIAILQSWLVLTSEVWFLLKIAAPLSKSTKSESISSNIFYLDSDQAETSEIRWNLWKENKPRGWFNFEFFVEIFRFS